VTLLRVGQSRADKIEESDGGCDHAARAYGPLVCVGSIPRRLTTLLAFVSFRAGYGAGFAESAEAEAKAARLTISGIFQQAKAPKGN
jgi:hypothetical protein